MATEIELKLYKSLTVTFTLFKGSVKVGVSNKEETLKMALEPLNADETEEARLFHHLSTLREALHLSPENFLEAWGDRPDSDTQNTLIFQAEKALIAYRLNEFFGSRNIVTEIAGQLHSILESERLEDVRNKL
jgi:hypothetical protein